MMVSKAKWPLVYTISTVLIFLSYQNCGKAPLLPGSDFQSEPYFTQFFQSRENGIGSEGTEEIKTLDTLNCEYNSERRNGRSVRVIQYYKSDLNTIFGNFQTTKYSHVIITLNGTARFGKIDPSQLNIDGTENLAFSSSAYHTMSLDLPDLAAIKYYDDNAHYCGTGQLSLKWSYDGYSEDFAESVSCCITEKYQPE